MTTLKNRNNSPPNGFQFVQAETGFGEGKIWWDFGQMCREIRDNRLGNPRFNLTTDLNQIMAEADQRNALRCLSIKGAGIYVVQDASTVPKTMASQHVPAGVAGAVNKISAVAAGAKTIGAWLGKGGKPVPGILADVRAAICAVCPKNDSGGLTRFFTVPAAATIHREIERRNQMKLGTLHDDKLGICSACLCPLKLKVHTPLVDIVDHMPESVKSELDPGCWILHENTS